MIVLFLFFSFFFGILALLITYHRGLSGINQTNSRTITDGNPCTASGRRQTSEPASFAKLSPYSRNVDTIVPRKKHAWKPPVSWPRYLG